MSEPFWKIVVGDCRDSLRELEDESVHCVITSPPYFGLRDYGTGEWVGGDADCDHVKGEMRRGTGLADSPATTRGGGRKILETDDIKFGAVCRKCGAQRIDDQIGLEETPELYVEAMVAVFREVWRVLRHDGVVWLNVGDSYAGAGPSGASYQSETTKRRAAGGNQDGAFRVSQRLGEQGLTYAEKKPVPPPGLKSKDLIGIPWRLALALQADGWYLRSEVIWSKPNPMPESVLDRPTKAHEQVFLLAKSERYFYDAHAVREANKPASIERVQRGWHRKGHKWEDAPGDQTIANSAERAVNPAGRNKRSVWEVPEELWVQFLAWLEAQPPEQIDVWDIATIPYKEAHFATFPPSLVEPCVSAGTPEEGVCSVCGAPRRRLVRRARRLDGEEGLVEGNWEVTEEDWREKQRETGVVGVGHWRYSTSSETIGWRPSCACGAPKGVEPDDLDLIESPTGEGGTDDPTLDVGRAGYSRPRGAGAGRRTMTRYQQRCYAAQLKNLPQSAVEKLIADGHTTPDAWAHYTRTDRAGARPLPPKLLALLLDDFLVPVDPPDWEPPAAEPAVVLDLFAGAGTTGVVALRRGRSFVGLELSADYAEVARTRIRDDAPLFNVGSEVAETPGAAA